MTGHDHVAGGGGGDLVDAAFDEGHAPGELIALSIVRDLLRSIHKREAASA